MSAEPGRGVLVRVDGAFQPATVAKRPSHLRDKECVLCLEVARLLLPVRVFLVYSGDDPSTLYLCRDCRINWRDDHYACLASTVEHSRRQLAAQPTEEDDRG